ncbi:MAG: hypothetical protein R2682_01925 [Pyrinomonadaceae bacterium]
MKNLNRYLTIVVVSIAIAMNMSVPFAPGGPQLQAQTNSAESSPALATPAPEATPSVTPTPDSNDAALRRACADAVDELKAARKLIASQTALIDRSGELNLLERQFSDGLKNLRTLDAAEKQKLTEALAAKDRVIANIEAENAVLRKQRNTFWKKLKVFTIGAAASAIAGAILLNR